MACLPEPLFPDRRAFRCRLPPRTLSSQSCYPGFLQGRVDTYEVAYSRAINNVVDRQTQEPLTFDFSFSHPEDIPVHKQCGGGLHSIKALRHLRFLPELQATFRKHLGELGTDEKNVHTLLDLMILASARVFHSCRTSQGRESGFSLLARSLRANPGVIRRLLNG